MSKAIKPAKINSIKNLSAFYFLTVAIRKN